MSEFSGILGEVNNIFPDLLPVHPIPKPARKRKRKSNRGGQAGNRNARRHGAYSKTLTETETTLYHTLIEKQFMDPDIAFIRVKLETFFRTAPENRSAMLHLVKMLTNYCRRTYNLKKRSDIRALYDCIELLIDQKAQVYIRVNESMRSQDEGFSFPDGFINL